MMYTTVATASINTTPLDWEGNRERILKAAEGIHASFILFPELCLSGYGCDDWFLSADTCQKAEDSLATLRHELAHKGVVLVGLPVEHQGAVYNGCAVIHEGDLLGIVLKQNLAGDGIHYEPRWFRPWPKGEAVHSERFDCPMGDLFFEVDGVRFGVEICEDAWVADRTGRDLAAYAPDIIFNPSASHFSFGKHTTRRRWVEDGSRAFNCVYALANLQGCEAGRAVYDGGNLIASGGEILKEGPRFSLCDHDYAIAEVDLSVNRMRKASSTSARREVQPHRNLVRKRLSPYAPLTLPVRNKVINYDLHGSRVNTFNRNEEFLYAQAVALYDYARKSGSTGFAISLSGGVDSTVCALLSSMAVAWAVGSRGEDTVRKELRVPEGDCLYKSTILTAYQATENSSQATQDAAEKVASDVGSTHLNLDLRGVHESYLQTLSQALGREPTWEEDDVTLQNLQARIRAPGIWFFANVRGALLLSTSNRSESSVGYTTMDGDTAGGIAPIAGVDKQFLIRWLQWVSRRQDFHSVGVKAVLELKPSAELRPTEQTDEEDLMPYPILDAIQKAAIRDKKGPLGVLETVQGYFPDVDDSVLSGYVDKFFKLWSRNQWKRERFAPSFHMDDTNLDPKTWCRFPILSHPLPTLE